MSGTSAVVDGKLEPVDAAPVTRQLVVTGQGMYEMFIGNDGTGTRMQWIREYLVPMADPLQVKGACDEMVKIAHQRDQALGVPEKERGPKRNTAMQTRTFVQQIYGALKFAPEQMATIGFDAETGWNEARVMAKPALERAGKIWNGLDIPSDIQREQAQLARQRKVETDAYLQATKDNPRVLNESFSDWTARVAQCASANVVQAQADKRMEDAHKILEGLTKKHDRDTLGLVLSMLTEHLKSEADGMSEISEEEANALLAQAQADGQVEVHTDEETV